MRAIASLRAGADRPTAFWETSPDAVRVSDATLLMSAESDTAAWQSPTPLRSPRLLLRTATQEDWVAAYPRRGRGPDACGGGGHYVLESCEAPNVLSGKRSAACDISALVEILGLEAGWDGATPFRGGTAIYLEE